MSQGSKKQQTIVQDFVVGYAKRVGDVERLIQIEVMGADMGVVGYTTVEQADRLAEVLALAPDMRLLDVGGGLGWPGVYLAEKMGCQVVITDVPASGIGKALRRAARQGLGERCSFALASGVQLPFRARSFDAVVHTAVR